jgi:hypothetical protein
MGPNTFDVTELRVIETGGDPLNNIVDQGEEFKLEAHIEGSGDDWDNYEMLGCKVRARFYGDGMGPGVSDHDFGIVFAEISDDFWVETEDVSVDEEGIFRCGVVVNLYSGDETNALEGYVGYNENCPLQVNPHEEIP